MTQPLFIIDIDHTIIDSDKIEQEQLALINQYRPLTLPEFRTIKNAVKDESGKYTLERATGAVFARYDNRAGFVKQLIDQTLAIDFQQYYYPGVIDGLTKLAKVGKLIFFSQGEEDQQRAKLRPIMKLGIVKLEDVFVYANKQAETQACLNNTQSDQVFVIDDHQRYLKTFKDCDHCVVTVLVTTQEQVGGVKGLTFRPDVVARTFTEAVDMVLERVE